MAIIPTQPSRDFLHRKGIALSTDTSSSPKTNSPYPQPMLKQGNGRKRKIVRSLVGLLALIALTAIGIFTWKQLDSNESSGTTVTVRMQTSQQVVDSVRTGNKCVSAENVTIPGPDDAPRAYGDSTLSSQWDDGRLTVTVSGGAQKRVSAFFVGDNTAVLSGMDQVQEKFVLNSDAFDDPITKGTVSMCIGPVS